MSSGQKYTCKDGGIKGPTADALTIMGDNDDASEQDGQDVHGTVMYAIIYPTLNFALNGMRPLPGLSRLLNVVLVQDLGKTHPDPSRGKVYEHARKDK